MSAGTADALPVARFVATVSAPGIIGGGGLLKRRSWSRYSCSCRLAATINGIAAGLRNTG